jgi:hypothetical protein
MNGVEFLESVLAGNPLTAPLVLASKLGGLGGKSDKKDAKPEAPKPPSTPVGGGRPAEEGAGTPDLPTQQPIPPGGASGASLPAILETLIKLQTQEAQATRAAQIEEARRAREFYPEKAQIDIETYRQQAQVAEQSALERMRAKTARDIELQTIDAWQKITQAQINKDAMIGLGMMNLAYTAGMPNPNVLQAGASFASQGRAGFGTPISII